MAAHSTLASCEPDGRALRRQAFVDAARDAFFARGYGETTMSSIAAAVGGSKTTLWSYFPSKEELFAAVVDDIGKHFSPALTVELPLGAPVRATLQNFATAMLRTILSPPIIALHRVVTGEAQRFPELGALFYERGPRRGKERLAAFIADAMAEGRLRQGDPMVAAWQFSALCQSGCFQEILLAIQNVASEERIAKDIDAAIDTFMRAWTAE
ncbi:TetR family transcriptional regulator [Sphingomonas sp. Leaf357]|nr:TetR family transcriptional regulator [Sphingomonas sp. Leaf357]